MSRDDRFAGGWHGLATLGVGLLTVAAFRVAPKLGAIGVGLFVWEVGGLLGWWRMASKRQYHECKCG